MEKFYSTEAMISRDGKNYKGILDCFADRIVLHTENKTIYQYIFAIENIVFITGVTKVSFLNLYTKEKSFFQIRDKEKDSESEKIIVSDEDVSALAEAFEKYRKDNANSKKHFKEELDGRHLDCILNNPYRILGIAANANNEEIDAAFQKIKKFIRLNTIKSYKTDYLLPLFKAPERNIASCQNALLELKNIRHKWFWFNSSDACQKWFISFYRKAFISSGVENADYDSFLCQYLYGLVYDSCFEDRNLWHSVFAFIQDIIGNKNTSKLATKMADNAVVMADEDLLNSFQDSIVQPIDSLCEISDIKARLNLYRTIRKDKFPTLKEFKRRIGRRIVDWYDRAEKAAMDVSCKYLGTGKLTSESAYEVWLSAQRYEESVQDSFADTLAAFTMVPVRSEMLKASYGKVMHSFMVLLFAGGRVEDALKYANYAYPYVDNEKKQAICNCFGKDKIESARLDTTLEDVDDLGDN